ncbi:MAG: folate family ECF transporter S component [Clostridia bacterium]|nr:folate family ECF transporter S component [Clostridia bacterium]
MNSSRRIFEFAHMLRLSVLIALQVVMSRFLSFSTFSVKLGFGFVPVMLAGALYGVPGGLVCAALSDIIGALLFPIGKYFIGYTITAALTGVLYGYFFSTPKNALYPVRILLAYAINAVVVTMGLNTLCIAYQYGDKSISIWARFLVYLPKRAIEAAVMLPVQFTLTYLLMYRMRLDEKLLKI